MVKISKKTRDIEREVADFIKPISPKQRMQPVNFRLTLKTYEMLKAFKHSTERPYIDPMTGEAVEGKVKTWTYSRIASEAIEWYIALQPMIYRIQEKLAAFNAEGVLHKEMENHLLEYEAQLDEALGETEDGLPR